MTTVLHLMETPLPLRLAFILNTPSRDQLQNHNFNEEAQVKSNDFQVNKMEDTQETKWSSTGRNVASKKIEGLVFTMNAAMDYAQNVADRCDELQKSSRVLFTSLAKLESVLNEDTLGKIGHSAKLFGPQNDHESAKCKGLKSTPSHSHDQIPSKKAKPSNDPNDIFDEDEKINLFDNDSKDIKHFNNIFDEDGKINLFDYDSKDVKPLNDSMQSNSLQMIAYKIDTKDYSNNMEICTSNYKRVIPSKGPGNSYSVPRLTNVGIEQFQTPLAMHIPMEKIPKFESRTSLSYNKRRKGHHVTLKEPASNKALSMFMSKFPPTPDMRLTHAETKVCAYVFYPDNKPSEVLLRIGNTIATTRDIECLCPDREIEDKIINIMALKITLMQRRQWMQLHHIAAQTVWSLPPSFADDVRQGDSVNKLLKAYAIHWMPPSSSLKYIYLPIKDEGHWYLIVVSLEERVIHNLDSCLQVEHVSRRHNDIKTMCSVLPLMISSEYFPDDYLSSIHKIRWWEIVDTKGISKYEQSVRSAVWILEWMKMEHCFQPNLFIGVHNEKVVRMRTTMDLLLCSLNEYKERLEAKAESFWNLQEKL